MRIEKLNTGLSFRAGKVELYSDFDGTYLPAKHVSLHNPNANSHMVEYCDRMDKFLKSTKDDLHFHITTGRTFGEYESVSWLLKMRNFRLPFPETLITKNGSDRFVKNGDDLDFYENGKFPFSYSNPFKQKEDDIKQLTNWDGTEIRKELKNLADKYKIRLVEADSENSVSDYGFRSLYSEGKLNADEWKRLPNDNGRIKTHQTPIADYSLGSRNDGNLKLNLIFSPDYGFCQERNNIYDGFMNDLKKFMNDRNVKYHIDWEEASNRNHHRITCSITPQIEGGMLTKLYDTKEAVKNAVKNNDIVITAGDGSNDFEMLNPMSYIDKEFENQCKKNSNHKDFYKKSLFEKLKDLKKVYSNDNSDYVSGLRKELTKNGYLRKLESIPFYSLVVKTKNTKLQTLIDVFAPLGKVIEINSGEIDNGVKQAVKNHCSRNKNFNNSISQNLYSLIFGVKKSSKHHRYLPAKIAGGVAVTSIAGFAGYKYITKD